MASTNNSHILEIIIKARDQASQVAQKVDQELKNINNTASKGPNQFHQYANSMAQSLQRIRNKNRELGQDWENVTNKMHNTTTQAFNKIYNVLDKIPSRVDPILNRFGQLSPRFKTVAESMKTSMDTAIEQIKSKFKSLETTAHSSIDSLRNKVSSFSTSVGSTMSSGLMNIANRMDGIANSRVGQAFSTLRNTVTTSLSGMRTGITNFVNQGSAAMQKLVHSTGQLGQGFTMLKGILSGFVAMIGYDLVTNIVRSTREVINARGNIESFSRRLGMSGSEVSDFSKKISALQQEFRKVDMQQMGASALELATKLGVSKDKVADLARTMAVAGSAFAREGRTMHDSILAVNDALQGEFRRLREIGITQDMLKKNGWNGHIEDTTSLIDALNKTMQQLGLEETAKQVTNLDDAWAVLNIAGSHLLTEIIIPLTPLIVSMTLAFAGAANAVAEFWQNMPDTGKLFILSAIITGIGIAILLYLVPALQAATTAIWKAVVAKSALLIEFVAIAAIIAVVIAVIYEVGKAMGWWTDGASAMKVVGDALRNCFNQIVDCLKAVYNGFMEVANPMFQEFWNYLMKVVGPLIGSFQMLWNSLVKLGDAFGGASGSGKLFADIGRLLASTVLKQIITSLKILIAILVPIIEFVINSISNIVDYITLLKQAWDDLMNGNISFVDFLVKVFGGALTLLSSIFMNIIDAVVSMLGNLLEIIGVHLDEIWNGIVTWFNGIPGWINGQINSFVQGLNDGLKGAYDSVMSWLGGIWSGIVDWFTGLPGYISQALDSSVKSFDDWLKTIWNNLVAGFGSIISGVQLWIFSIGDTIVENLTLMLQSWGEFSIQVITWLTQLGVDILTHIVTWLVNLPITIYTYLALLIESLWLWGSQLITQAVLIGSQFLYNLLMWFAQIPIMIWNFLIDVLAKVFGWNTQMTNDAKAAGQNFVYGVINWVSQLPIKLWEFLRQCIDKIVQWALDLLNKGKEAGQKLVDGFKDKIKELPQKMKEELDHILSHITDYIPKLWEAAKNLAWNAVQGFINGLDSHSPGIMARTMGQESVYINEAMRNQFGTLAGTANEMANTIVDNFGTPTLGAPIVDTSMPVMPDMSTMPTITASQPATMTPVGFDSSAVTSATTGIMEQGTLLATSVEGNALAINTAMAGTQLQLQNMVLASTTGTTTVLNNNLQIQTSYVQLMNGVNTVMNFIIQKTVTGWNSVRTTTQQNLNGILNSTKSVTSQMIDAWNTMKNQIIKAAENIKTESTNHFNKLSDTIRTFYHKLQNPGGWGDPHGASHHSTRIAGGRSRRIKDPRQSMNNSIMRVTQPNLHFIQPLGIPNSTTNNTTTSVSNITNSNFHEPVTRGTVKANTQLSQSTIDYILPKAHSSISVSDMEKAKANALDNVMKYKGAGWLDVVNPNVDFIKKVSREWSMAGPIVWGKYPTRSSLFKVKEFENGAPNIDFSTFKMMAEDVFDQCVYDFYMDSDRYGSWQAAFSAGAMNCSDSTDALIWMARQCGLSATKVHGYWGSIGHFWANVEGHKMDTTGWMNRHDWAPAISHSGAPAHPIRHKSDFEKLSDNSNSSSDSVTHDGKVILEHRIVFENQPDNVTKDELLEALNNLATDDYWIQILTGENEFKRRIELGREDYNRQLRRNI